MTKHASEAPQENGRILKGGQDLPAGSVSGNQAPLEPIKDFELPPGQDERRIFQNGDTDREEKGRN